ncbi:hypothetical protein [Comamonas sp. JC664]|uniref:hypothetical protein n=1 Tax=Comamonas sp. JC664 TaxID=2801917 RepID=UPI00174C5D34|nr:hypothetical protein [Comamonas sp. JC664]MBL0698965.1 hypothetical protein [Comamonas sp. JC664]GHG79825.1 hypothetical protein GCM10012319_32070 [Comamonas sp. KCTC 72670]
MSRLLFAVVDSLFERDVQRADRVSAQHARSPSRCAYWREVAEATRAHLGWWRSLWPIGGAL